MYGALWRILPGPKWVRALICLVLLVLVILGLFEYVYPWIAANVPFFDNTVGN